MGALCINLWTNQGHPRKLWLSGRCLDQAHGAEVDTGGKLKHIRSRPSWAQRGGEFQCGRPFSPAQIFKENPFSPNSWAIFGVPPERLAIWPVSGTGKVGPWRSQGEKSTPHPRASKHQWNNTGVRAQKSSSHFLGLHCRYEKDIFTQPVMPWCQSALKVWWPSSSN